MVKASKNKSKRSTQCKIKIYPQMFDDNLVEQEFLNSLEGIAKEPIRDKLLKNIYIIPTVGFLLFFVLLF